MLNLTKDVTKKEGPKKIPGAPFLVSFPKLPAVKKDTQNSVPVTLFGLSYFVRLYPLPDRDKKYLVKMLLYWP